MGGVLTAILMALGMAEDRAVKLGQLFTLTMILLVLKKVLGFLFDLCKKPLFLAAIVAALTFFPETIGWIIMRLGYIELRVMALAITSVMPDIFGAGAGAYTSWSEIWQAGLNVLPQGMLDIINGVGVAYLLGMVTSTFTAVHTIKIYRHAMKRAGLM